MLSNEIRDMPEPVPLPIKLKDANAIIPEFGMSTSGSAAVFSAMILLTRLPIRESAIKGQFHHQLRQSYPPWCY